MQTYLIPLAGGYIHVRNATPSDDLASLLLIVRRRGSGTWHRAKFLLFAPPNAAYLRRDDGRDRTYQIHNIRIETKG